MTMRQNLVLLGAVGVSAMTQNTTSGGVAPHWGCGLLGALPGISKNGATTSEAQRMIDGIKGSSSFNKVSYWNWNLAPMANDDTSFQYLSKDFIFMPEQWGVNVVEDRYVREAGTTGYLDSKGQPSPSTMATIFLGANEPDMIGSCMGNMMGTCTGSCTEAEVRSGCPKAQIAIPPLPPADPLPDGHCNCWEASHATGVGFWPVGGCADVQPLPEMWSDNNCVGVVMDMWKQTAAIALAKGYQYLTTPLVAFNMDWVENFVEAACKDCQSIDCGCPTHIAWHFYASDCRPISLGGYQDFQAKLDRTAEIMEKYPFIQGAIVNEVGMLNCYQDGPDGACIPNGPLQKYPALNQTDHACPKTDELPNGMSTFLEDLIDRVIAKKTSDGRGVVSGFSWFNENMSGGTYNLQLFNEDGSINDLGESYIKACQKWAASYGPTPPPTPPTTRPPTAPTTLPPSPPTEPPTTCHVCTGGVCCNPKKGQFCPDGNKCCDCGSTACQC